MFHIRHWKLYSSSYGDGTQLGRYMQEAQDQHFINEGLGCSVPSVLMEANVVSKCSKEDDIGNVVLGENTTDEDWCAAQFVLVKSKKDGCTWKDLSNHLSGSSTGSAKNFEHIETTQICYLLLLHVCRRS